MKLVLRESMTRQYYVDCGQWTQDFKKAFSFEEVHEAIAAGRQEPKANMEVVLSYDDPFCELVLPISA
jgi:hypothetical protein